MIDLSDLPPFPQEYLVWPPADEPVEQAICRAFQTGDWGRYHGSAVPELEARLAEEYQVDHALTCCSGTVAVTIALRGLHLPPGSEVLLAAYDFPGNFRAIQEAGLRPVLVDIDPRTWSLDPQRIPEACSPQTKALIVSHLHGGLAPMRQLMKLGHDLGLAVVEDTCQAPGAIADGRPAGSWGDVSVLSFGGSKLLTAGRGGAVLTRRPEIYQRAKIYCERGNHAFPLSELQAAVVLPQLDQAKPRHRQRLEAVMQLRRSLADLTELEPVALNLERDSPAFYKHAWRCKEGQVRETLLAAAAQLGLPLSEGFRGFVKRPASQCRKVGTLEHARDAAEQTVLLHHPLLLHGDLAITQFAETVRSIVDRCRNRRH